jgi:hypothetical protein
MNPDQYIHWENELLKVCQQADSVGEGRVCLVALGEIVSNALAERPEIEADYLKVVGVRIAAIRAEKKHH